EVVDNIDPDAFEAAWAGGNPATTHWVAISKSGGTTETLAQLSVVRERARLAGFTPRITLVTGASGALRELADTEELPVFDVPEQVGGRFSVFTSAATVPLALAGHDVKALLSGALTARDHGAQAAARLAAFLVAAEKNGRNVVTLWSYAERLETVGEWFRQLWAESLGKRDASGTPVGQSPIHCVGSTDQHSMQQLMVEGPPDKVVLVLAHAKSTGLRVPMDGLGAGAGHSMDAILDAMRRATTAGMVRAGCPAMTLRLDDATLESAGALLMTFMAATVIAGELLGVDPYGQPGVEAAKIATKELLTDPGGDLDQDIAALLGEGEGIRVP
ncbi:MAG: glucose-6-phosphate isomerase, partial [Planctomycetota bacterium]